MCGIAGLVDPRLPAESLSDTARRMADALRHRGPDDAGIWSDPAAGIAFSHRRLSIIDLSPTGHQPMLSADGRYVITFNGEIYNYQALRAEEVAAGYPFRGASDTEVLLARISRLGLAQTLRATRGMFALALWDRQTRTLELARDRLGEKPLYYLASGGRIAFASEAKAFHQLAGWEARLDPAGLGVYLAWGYSRGLGTVLEDVHKVAPASILTFHTDRPGQAPVASQYWELPSAEPVEADPRERLDEADSLLRTAVTRQMVSDVPLGAFLSGGIDSSLVVAMMQADRTTPVRTFTIAFPEASHDEGPFAQRVASALGTRHECVELSERELLDTLPRVAGVYDEPFGDTSALPTLLLSAVARREVTVCLAGDGGDELFGGYRAYRAARGWARRVGWIPAGARRGLARAFAAVGVDGWDRVARLTPHNSWWTGDRILKAFSLLDFKELGELHGRITRHWPDPAAILSPVMARAVGAVAPIARARDVRDLMRNDQGHYLPDDIFTKVDRAAMSVSLEVRAPFVDADVVEFAARLPTAMLFDDRGGKALLRRLLARYLDPALYERPKRGFSAPVGRWLRGPLRRWADDLLAPDRLARQGIFAPVAVQRYWQEHLSGTREWQYLLWDVLMFQEWWDRQPRSPVC